MSYMSYLIKIAYQFIRKKIIINYKVSQQWAPQKNVKFNCNEWNTLMREYSWSSSFI